MKMLAYGGGTNSTALLIEMINRGIYLDFVLFSDTGAERPDTYKHVEHMHNWLKSKGHKGITTLKYHTKDGKLQTLEDDCHRYKRLPSLAYGFKGCSQKYKRAPQEKYLNNNPDAIAYWKTGNKIIKILGYDADEPHRAKFTEDNKYLFWYPLIDWDFGREECIEIIKKEGIKLPGKSSCFFCPAMKWKEIKKLSTCYPDLFDRAVAIEDNAKGNLSSVKGLARNHSWKNLIKMEKSQVKLFDIPESCDCYDG